MPAKTIGEVKINLSAGTADFILQMERANATVRKFSTDATGGVRQLGNSFSDMGGHGVSGVQAVSGALRVLEGGITNNLRAAERFTANILGLGPILQAAFPVIGAIAFAGIVEKVGGEVYNFYKEMRDAPEKMAGAWRALGAPLQLANDQMLVSIDRVQQEIAKLEGRRQSTLKLSIDEARVAADQLADSLDKDLQALHRFLDENDSNVFKKLWSGEQLGSDWGSDPLTKQIGGFTGAGGFNGEKSEILQRGNEALAKATTLKERDAAQTKTNIELLDAYDKQLKLVNTELIRRYENRMGGPLPIPKDEYDITGKEGPEVERAKVVLDQLNRERTSIVLKGQQRDNDAAKEAAKAAHDNARLERPFENKLAELKVQAEAAQARMAAAGMNEASRMVAEAHAKALIDIEEVEKGLQRLGDLVKQPTLPAAEKKKFEDLRLQEVRNAAEGAWQDKLRTTTKTITDQVKAQEMLTAAIGKGYEAVKAAAVETQLMSSAGVGAEHYNDPKWMKDHAADVASLRAQLGGAYESKHREEIANSIDKLGDQITLEIRLAQVQVQGAAAVRAVELQAKLAKMELAGATKEQIAAEIELNRVTLLNESAASVAKINDKIDAVKRLAAAQVQGAEAVRQAELENKYAEIRKQGGPRLPGLSGMTVAEAKEREHDQAARELEITAKVSQRINVYKDHLAQLDEEKARLIDIIGVHKATADQERALRDIENERLKIMVQQTIELGSARDGVKAFFLEMQKEGKTAAQSVYDSLNSALDQTSDNLAKLLSGQKTSWAKEFQSIGESLIKDAIKSDLQKGLGALGKAFPKLSGITNQAATSLAGKPDGTKQSPYHVIIEGAAGGGSFKIPGLGPKQQQDTGGPGGTVFGGGSQANPAIFSFLDLLSKNAPRSGGFNPRIGGIGEDGEAAAVKTGIENLLPFYLRRKGFPDSRDPDPSPDGSRVGLIPRTFNVDGSVTLGPRLRGPALPPPKKKKGIWDWIGLGLKAYGAFSGGLGGLGGGGDTPDVSSSITFPSIEARAMGGPVSPGTAYLVGEHGAELLLGASGRIASNTESMRMLNGSSVTHNYQIDARGTDPVQTERAVRAAIAASHKDAVSTSIRAVSDQGRRMPAGAR